MSIVIVADRNTVQLFSYPSGLFALPVKKVGSVSREGRGKEFGNGIGDKATFQGSLGLFVFFTQQQVPKCAHFSLVLKPRIRIAARWRQDQGFLSCHKRLRSNRERGRDEGRNVRLACFPFFPPPSPPFGISASKVGEVVAFVVAPRRPAHSSLLSRRLLGICNRE